MSLPPRILETPPDWTEAEKPTLPGSPASIAHPTYKRLLYFFIGTFIAISSSLGNGFISANLPLIQGEYSLTPSEAAWLPAAYVMSNVSANLILFKARQQYGLRIFSEIALLLFSGVLILHIFVQTFEMAVFVRSVSGFVAALLSSLGMYYVTQAFNREHFVRGLYLALGFQQLGIPLAWVISPYLVNVQDWKIFYSFELGLALCCLAMVVSLKLPRSLKVQVFELNDLVTFVLLASGFALLCVLLTQGPILWWFDAEWLAYVFIAGIVLVSLGFLFEHFRVNPLIFTRWIGTSATLRFIFGAFAIRFLMSEQSYAATNFLKTMGMGPDQFVTFYAVILVAILLGIVFSALTFSKEWATFHLFCAATLVLIGCAIDYQLTSDIRPENFYFSQFLVGFASGMFIGPLILLGFINAMQRGPSHIISFLVLFTATQSFGGLMGSGFFSTYQKIRTQNYQAELINTTSLTNPIVEQRLNGYTQGARAYTLDPVQASNQAQRMMSQAMNKEAQIRAYNDVIFLNGLFAVLLLLWRLSLIAMEKYRMWRKQSVLQ